MVVVGCGPVGALTANLLGARGVDTLVVERSTTPHGQSRAFSCDDEALRVYQQAGLLDRVRAEVSVPPLAEYVNRRAGSSPGSPCRRSTSVTGIRRCTSSTSPGSNGPCRPGWTGSTTSGSPSAPSW